jgi:hypothetical protein
MPIRLIAIDLDGTLLGANHTISAVNVAVIARVRAQGATVLLATGRMFASARPFAQQLGLRGPQITLNGAVIGDPPTGALRTRAVLAPADLAAVLAELVAREIPYTIFGPDTIYAEPGTPFVEILEAYGEPPPVRLPRAELLLLPAPIKVLTFLGPGPLDAELRDALAHRVEVIRTGNQFYEFLAPGTSKGAALAEIAHERGIARDEILAIGDSDNDLSMFAVAGTSAAMAGAAPHVQAQASWVTASSEGDGVARALERFANV